MMEEIITRVWNNLVDRIGGPLSLRLFLQPTMAAIFAMREGLKDAREGRPPYFWALFTNPDERREMLRSGWKSVANVFCLGVVLDVVYQYIALRKFYPGEALIVAFILAILPYLLIRGPVNRIAQILKSKAAASEKLR